MYIPIMELLIDNTYDVLVFQKRSFYEIFFFSVLNISYKKIMGEKFLFGIVREAI